MATTSSSPNGISNASTEAKTRAKCWANKGDWNKYQALIRELYEEKTLPEVMLYMESHHDFHATEKMYKTRIKDWGLKKYNKEKGIRAIVPIRKKRMDDERSSRVHVNGIAIDHADASRYRQRQRVSINNVIAQRTASKTPKAMTYSAPLPSPISALDILIIPEQIFFTILDYYKRSFGSGMWISTSPCLDCRTIKVREDAASHLDPLFTQCSIACRLFAQGSFQEAGQTLISATAGIKEILLAEHPRTLSNLFALVIYLCRQGRCEISLAVLRQFCNLGGLLMGREHHLARICGWLSLVNIDHFDDVIARCLRSAGDNFESFLGPMHRSTLYSRIEYAERVDRECDINLEMVTLQHMLSNCNQMLGFQDVRTLDARLSLAFHYLKRQKYFQAREVGQDTISHAQYLQPVSDGVYYRAEGLWIIANSQYALGETQLAEENLRQAIELRQSEWSTQDGRARLWLVRLESWLVGQGQLDSAALVESRRKEILASRKVD